MKNGFGVIELLIVAIIAVIVCFFFLGNQNGRSNPFEDTKNVHTKQKIIEDKIQQIEKTQNLKHQIEMNLKNGN